MLDAIEHIGTEPTTAERLERFLGEVEVVDRSRRPSVALGEDMRVATERIIGSGLELDGELIQLAVLSRESAVR